MTLAFRQHTLLPPPLPPSLDDEPVLDALQQLHQTMSVRVLQLEATVEDLPTGSPQAYLASYVRAAFLLRDQLVRVSGIPEDDTVPALGSMFPEALRSAYGWILEELDWIRQLAASGPAEPRTAAIPAETLGVFHELVDLGVDDALATTLLAIEDALHQLLAKRDRLQRVVVLARKR
jgi:hypothetical protein